MKKRVIASALVALALIGLVPVEALSATTTAIIGMVLSSSLPVQTTNIDGIGTVQFANYDSSTDYSSQLWGNSGYQRLEVGHSSNSNSHGSSYTTNYVLLAVPGKEVVFSSNASNMSEKDGYSLRFGTTKLSGEDYNTYRGTSIKFIMPQSTSTKLTAYESQYHGSDYSDVYTLLPLTQIESGNPSSEQAANLQQALLNYKASNSTTISDLQALANNNIDTSKFTAVVSQTARTNANESSDGEISGRVTVTENSTGKQTASTFSIVIPRLAQSLNTIATSLSNFCNNYSATNSSKQTDFINAIAITNQNYNLSVSNWSLIPATDTQEGTLSCNVNILEGGTVRQTIGVNKKIYKLPTTTATASNIIQNILNNYIATNSSDKITFLNMLKSSIGNNISISLPTWTLTPSGENSIGRLTGTISVSDGSTNKTINIDKSIDYLDESITTAQAKVQSALDNLSPSNYITQTQALNIAKSAVDANYFNVTISGFNNTNSTESSTGTIVGTITIVDKSNSANTKTVTINKTIPILSQTVDNASAIVSGLLTNYSVDNNTTKTEMLNDINKSINTNYITASLPTFTLNPATETSKGSLTVSVQLVDKNDSSKTKTVNQNYVIDYLDESITTAQAKVQSALDNLSPSNYINQTQILNIAKSAVDANYFNVTVSGFNNTNSTESSTGTIVGTITIVDKNNSANTKTVTINKTIPILSQTVDNASAIVSGLLTNYSVDNNTTKTEMLNDINKSINTNYITASLPTFTLNPATETSKGSLTVSVTLVDKNDSSKTKTVNQNYVIDYLDQSITTAQAKVQSALDNLSPNNYINQTQVLNIAKSAVDSNYFNVAVSGFNNTNSTESSTGTIVGTITIVDKSNSANTKTVTINKTIPILPQTVDNASVVVTSVLENYSVSNNITKDGMLVDINKSINTNYITASIPTFKLTPATESDKGSLTVSVQLVDKNDSSKTKTVNKTYDIDYLEQSIVTAQAKVQSSIDNLSPSNYITQTQILNIAKSAVDANYFNVTVSGFNNTNSTESSTGTIVGTITIVDKSNSANTKTVTINKTIPILPQTVDNASIVVNSFLSNYDVDNSLTKDKILADVNKSINTNYISASIDEFALNKATETVKGSLNIKVTLKDKDNDSKTLEHSYVINVTEQSLGTLYSMLNNYCENYNANNGSKPEDFTNAIVITNQNYSIETSNWDLKEATDTEEGYLSCTVYIKENGSAVKVVNINKTIPKLPTTTETAKEIVQGIVDNYTATNFSDKVSLLNACKNAVGNHITVTIPSWKLTPSSETTRGTLVGDIDITDGTTNDKVEINKVIETERQSVETVKYLYQKALADMNAFNTTTANDILNNVLITNQDIKVNMEDFKINEATESKSGTVTGIITIKDSNTSESIPVNLKIMQLQQSVATVAELFEKRLNNFVATNGTIDKDVLSLVYVNNEKIEVNIEAFSVLEATDTDEGLVSGIIKISDGVDTEEVEIKKPIKVLSQKLSTSVRLVQNVINNYGATNDSTFDQLLIACNDVVSQNIDVYYKVNDKLEKNDSTEVSEGNMNGTIVITDGTTIIEIPFNIIISKLPQTVEGAQQLITAGLKNFKANNDTVEQDVLNAVGVSVRNSSIDIVFGTDDESFNKTESTVFKDGLIKGTIHVTDGTTTVKIPIQLTINQLDQTIDEAEQGIDEALPNFIVNNDTTPDEIKKQLEDVCGQNIVIVIKDSNKTAATVEAPGSIKTTVIPVDKNTGNTKEISLELTIPRLEQTIDEAKNTINIILPTLKVTNETTADSIKQELQSKVGDNINIDIKDFDRTEATVTESGKITAVVVVTDKNTGDTLDIPIDLIIGKLQQTIDEAKDTINIVLPIINVTNGTTADSIKQELQSKVGENINLDIKDFNKNEATINKDGEIKAIVAVTDKNTGDTLDIPIDLVIGKLQQTIDEAKNTVTNTLPTLQVGNDTTKDDLQNQLQDKVGDNITIEIGDKDFNKTPATISTPGKITGVVTVIDKNTGSQTTVPIDLVIDKLPSQGSGGGGSSSNHDSLISIPDQTSDITEAVEKGEWKFENGTWHYYVNNVMKIGWVKAEGLWYYFDIDGVMQIGWLYDNGEWYYLNPNPGENLGVMETGWLSYNGGYFYLNSSGAMAKGWQVVNGNWYYFQLSGSMKTGWFNDTDGNWYYLNPDGGAMARGWQKVNDAWYYLEASGMMKIGWFYDNGNWYYLTNSGAMARGWFKDTDGNWYYADQSGAMLRSTVVNGYNLDDQGKLI
ncbi:hypothetical protein OD350_29035 (plasmid) [Clostridium beijerinckii]|uniref:hypothetical protein n=1 Tax=Clostridium beijerinckii TaxID=1520 RepID=UPI002225E648|nr:hypothetical protein [Clostridium beijerinckii]UYZ39120.1 hypothetical protein OD350_29035 [Clostridium beijerinckii]